MQNTISLHDKNFKPYISAEEIQKRIENIATQLMKDYGARKPLFLAILNGSFMFASDLMKATKLECEISFVKIASYQGTSSTGNVKTLIGLDVNIEGREVIIVEDIVDTGKTLSEFMPVLQGYHPQSISIATLLFKPSALKFNVHPKYVGFEVPNDFLVGYGLDYDGLGRNLDGIYQVC